MHSSDLYSQYKARLELINEQIVRGPDSVTDDMMVAFHQDCAHYQLNQMSIRGEDLQYMLNLIANVLRYVEQRKSSIESDLCEIRAVDVAKHNYQKQMK